MTAPGPPSFDPRTVQDYLADAERFERWAVRCATNQRLSGSFRQLAAEARAKALNRRDHRQYELKRLAGEGCTVRWSEEGTGLA